MNDTPQTVRISPQTQDYIDIQDALNNVDLDGRWIVLRRGRPGARVRVLYRGHQPATMMRFAREQQRMRQGMLALIDPMGHIDCYATDGIVRWRLLRPRGNVAHYWRREGLRVAAQWLAQRASRLRRVAAGMTSEYDDPSVLTAQANALADAADAIRAMQQTTTMQRR